MGSSSDSLAGSWEMINTGSWSTSTNSHCLGQGALLLV